MTVPSATDKPENLEGPGSELWDRLTGWTDDTGAPIDFDPRELELVRQACAAAETISMLEWRLEESGEILVAGSTGQTIVNPLIIELRHQRTALAALLGKVDWPVEAGEWDRLTASARGRKAARARWG